MLSASRRLLCLNRAASNLNVTKYAAGRLTWRTQTLLDSTSSKVPNFLLKQPSSRNFAIAAQSIKLQNVSETGLSNELETDVQPEEQPHETSFFQQEGGRSHQENRKPFRRDNSSSSRGRERFRNYSYGDYATADILRRDFERLLQKDDAVITPVTAYQFIRNCGNRMSAESPENRIQLVKEIWQTLKDKGVELETTHHNTLLSVYIQNRHNFSPLEFLSSMQEGQVQPDKSTYMLIVQAYCQEGDLSGALRVIEFMTKQEIPVTEPVYTALVTGYSKNDDMDGAYQVLDTMRENGITPEVDTYTALIAGYASKGDFENIDKVFIEMESKSVKANSLVFMNMLDSLCRHGHSSLIPEGLARIKHKTPVEIELRYFMQRLISRGDYESAAILAKNNQLWLTSDLLRQEEFSPYNLFVYRLLKVTKPMDEMVRAMKVLEAHEITSTPLEDVLELSFMRRNTEDGIAMLRMLKESNRKIKSHYSYPILVQLAAKQDTEGILYVLSFLSENNVKIDANMFKVSLRAFDEGDKKGLENLMKFAKDRGIRVPYNTQNENLTGVLNGNSLDAFLDIVPAISVGVIGSKDNSDKLVDFFLRTYDTEQTCRAIVELDKKNLYRLGWILFKIFQSFNNNDDTERSKEAFKLFQMLVEKDAKKGLTHFVYTTLLSTLFRNNLRDEFFSVVNHMKEEGIEPNEAQYFIMLKMSSLIGNSAAAQFCFDKLKALHEPTEAQYNGLLIAYGKDGGKGKASSEPNKQYVRKVTALFEEIKDKGMKPYELTISHALVSYLSLGNIQEADEVKKTFGIGAPWRRYAVYNEYLRAYSKIDNIEAAEQLFKEMKDLNSEEFPSAFSYNQLIGVHKNTGNIERMNELIAEMKERNIELNKVTYGEMSKTLVKSGEPKKALDLLESITEGDELPSVHVLYMLVDEFMEKNDVESCERVVALLRRQKAEDWVDQKLNLILLYLYLKDNNFTAAEDVIKKDGFTLTQSSVMTALRKNSNDIDFITKIKDFLRDNNLNHSLMDYPMLNAYIAENNVEAALKLYAEKAETDSSMPNGFLSKLAKFLKSCGREIPFDESLLAKKQQEEHLDAAVEEIIEGSPISDEQPSDSEVKKQTDV